MGGKDPLIFSDRERQKRINEEGYLNSLTEYYLKIMITNNILVNFTHFFFYTELGYIHIHDKESRIPTIIVIPILQGKYIARKVVW